VLQRSEAWRERVPRRRRESMACFIGKGWMAQRTNQGQKLNQVGGDVLILGSALGTGGEFVGGVGFKVE
jgi:hypothetical protein